METRGYVCVCGCKLHQDQYWILVENPFFVVIHTIAVSSECMYTNSQVLFSRKKNTCTGAVVWESINEMHTKVISGSNETPFACANRLEKSTYELQPFPLFHKPKYTFPVHQSQLD